MKKTCILLTTFLILTQSAYAFIDIKQHWAEDYIYSLHNMGLVNGQLLYLTHSEPVIAFFPDRPISRVEYTKLLVLTLTDTLQPYASNISDIPADEWYADYIQTALTLGIIDDNLINENLFFPDDPATREFIAYMTAKAINYMIPGTSAFPVSYADDNDFSTWSAEAVSLMHETEIMQGYKDYTFRPQGYATRAETTAVLMRYLDYIRN